ncbi:hypothetical protein ACLB2K_070217 [Fragaria x ananassa]
MMIWTSLCKSIWSSIKVKRYSLKVEQKSYLLPISTRNLDAWVRLAIAKGVEDIQLLLDRPYLASYVFPYQLLFQGSSSLKHLALCDCILRQPPPDFDGFNNLRSLSLSYVTLDQIFMAHLFSNCLLLESLKIKNCHGLSHLNIVGDRLSDLKLSHCGGIELSAPNLVSLEFCGDFSSIISVTTSPRLARILADVEGCVQQYILALHRFLSSRLFICNTGTEAIDYPKSAVT